MKGADGAWAGGGGRSRSAADPHAPFGGGQRGDSESLWTGPAARRLIDAPPTLGCCRKRNSRPLPATTVQKLRKGKGKGKGCPLGARHFLLLFPTRDGLKLSVAGFG